MTTRKARTRMTALIITVAAGLTTLGGTVVGSAAAGAATPAAVSTVPSGSYTAQPQGNSWSFTFYVSSNRKQIQDIASPSAYLYCTPGSAVAVPFSMASLPLRANGTFGGTSTVKGVYGSYPATYTYTFAGTVRRADSKGPARGAGTFRATLVYTDNVKHTCTSKSTTSNTTGWTATRDKQFTQTTARPPSGSYTAQPQGNSWSFAFFVSASRTQIQDIASPSAYLYCTGGSAISVPFTMASIPLAANGSFSGTTSSSSPYQGHPATFTYSLSGHFHGVDNNGVARAAGQIRTTVVYTDSAPHTCTSNTMAWAGKRTGS